LFRRSGGGFFGKILKVDPTVTTQPPARLPVFRGRLAMATVLVAAGPTAWTCAIRPAGGDQPAASVYSRGADPVEGGVRPAGASDAAATAAAAADAAAQAERIVASSLAVLARADSVSLKLRQKARVGDRVLVGTGRYVQSGQGEEQRFRFDSTLTCDTETFELTEVSDGLFCWSHRHNGNEPATLQRVDVRRVRGRLAELKAPEAADGTVYLGGLQRTLRLLRHWFRFTQATPGDLEGVPVWIVDGSWPTELLTYVLPELKDRAATPGGIAPADLPDGTPWSVRLCIARNDLVPRRVEWLAIPGPRPVADAPPEPIAVMDLYDVELNGPIDATAFFYQPATEGLVDITEMHVNGLGLMR
jgi:hypothetical protein